MTATVPLYELGAMQHVLDAWYLETEGEETPELAALSAELGQLTSDKVERWGLWLRGLDLQAETIRAEEKRLAERRQALTRARQRSAEQLCRLMEVMELPKVKAPTITVAVQSNGPKVVGEMDEESLRSLAMTAPDFVRHVPESFEVNRLAVLAAWREQRPIPSGLAVVETTGLRIR